MDNYKGKNKVINMVKYLKIYSNTPHLPKNSYSYHMFRR